MGTVLNVLHVLTAVFLVGPMALLPMTALRAVRAGDGSAVQLLGRATKVFTWASLLVAVLGFGVAGIFGIPLGTPWVLASIVLYLGAFALSLALVVPALGRTGTDLRSDRASGGARYGRIAAGSGIVSLLLGAVTVLMVWQPGAG